MSSGMKYRYYLRVRDRSSHFHDFGYDNAADRDRAAQRFETSSTTNAVVSMWEQPL